jgi:chloride channel 3/4/5
MGVLTGLEKYKCDDWDAWNEIFGATSKGGSYILNYFMYVLYSVFFAFAAAVLVKHYAIYARHSGIPEIKTLLGGFVIRRFLGAWTLLTKSVGLVCLSSSVFINMSNCCL